MAVNYEKNHLYVILEDAPYREMLNGTKMTNFNYNVVKVNNPSRGWKAVFEDFKSSIPMLRKYKNRYTLLLMDFDDKDKSSEKSFANRLETFNSLIPQELKKRVFILGVNHKESEALKKLFQTPHFENIGKKLVENCPQGNLSNWNNTHLECNLPEIERMKENGIFDWLFLK